MSFYQGFCALKAESNRVLRDRYAEIHTEQESLETRRAQWIEVRIIMKCKVMNALGLRELSFLCPHLQDCIPPFYPSIHILSLLLILAEVEKEGRKLKQRKGVLKFIVKYLSKEMSTVF